MDYKKPRTQPESLAARRLVAYMRARYWYVGKIGGSKYNVGWPDYYAFHRMHGHRWIETKTPNGKLKPSQIRRFRQMTEAGDKVYVLTDETHYARLFGPPNWEMYIRGVI